MVTLDCANAVVAQPQAIAATSAKRVLNLIGCMVLCLELVIFRSPHAYVHCSNLAFGPTAHACLEGEFVTPPCRQECSGQVDSMTFGIWRSIRDFPQRGKVQTQTVRTTPGLLRVRAPSDRSPSVPRSTRLARYIVRIAA